MAPKPESRSKILENIYYNVDEPEAYAGANRLLKRIKGKAAKEMAKDWLRSQDTYSLFKPARKKYHRNRYIVTNINDLWQADLVDMQLLKDMNDGNSYILTVIDVFSKKAYAHPLKQKTAANIIMAFENIFRISGQKPFKLQTDKGKEFIAKDVQDFFHKNNVNHFTTSNPEVKASVVERFNRTLKTRMYRYLFHRNNSRYIDDLQDMVEGYNNTYHRSINMTPNQVGESNILEVYQNLNHTSALSKLKKKEKPLLKVGDYVRLSKLKHVFAKGYTISFTEEVFKITKVIPHPIPVYKIEDLNGEEVEGRFYEKEMQKVNYSHEGEFVIEEVIKTKGKGKNAQCFVKWRGYPTSFNSWILASDIKQI